MKCGFFRTSEATVFLGSNSVVGFAHGAFSGGSGGRHHAFEALAVGFEEAAEFFHGGQGDEGAGDEEFLIHACGGEFHLGASLSICFRANGAPPYQPSPTG